MASKAAQELGRKGGKATSEAKTAAARKNASRPRGVWATAIQFEVVNSQGKTHSGLIVAKGRAPADPGECIDWAWRKIIDDMPGVGIVMEFLELATTSKMLPR